MSHVCLTIDGREVSVPAGTTIWEAARQVGIDIPVVCHQPDVAPVGVCRMCVVDVGGRVLAAACVRACEEGMKVETASQKVERQRRMLTALLMSDHPTPCERERQTGDCELEALARRYEVGQDGSTAVFRGVACDAPARPRDASSPVIAVDHAACILCDRCIRACDEVQCNDVITRSGKGYTARIAFDLDQPMGESTCVSCGECVARCPTGALVNKPLGPAAGGRWPVVRTSCLTPEHRPPTAIESVCPYCGVGCAVQFHVKHGTIVRAEGRPSPGNLGRLCVKGRYGWDYALHEQRLTKPLIRRPEFYPKGPLSAAVRGNARGSGVRGQGSDWGRGRSLRPTSSPTPDPRPLTPSSSVDYAEVLPAFREATWDEALDLAASRLSAIKQRHGPGALAGFGSAKCSNEEAYLFQKLVRAVFGTNNVDHCTRLCHASSVAALLETIGSGAVTDTFGDIEHADVALLAGTNTTVNHPVAATFFKQAARRGTKLIVVDPRRPEIARFATYYAQIRPGSDVAFYNALMHVIVAEALYDKKFVEERTEGFNGLRCVVAAYAPEKVAAICGIDAETIRAIARTFAGSASAQSCPAAGESGQGEGGSGRRNNAMIFWGMGISQHTHGTDNARCLISLCLLTGNIGRRGTGLHPLRGQNNVQGASDAGLIPMVYPDYQPVGDPEVRAKFERAWGVPLDPQGGLTVVEIMHAALEGRVRGMLMMGENPFLSDPNVNKVRKALTSLDFLAVQDIFLTETAEFADVILPASSFFEKTGTYTNTDRRVQIGRTVIDPPGEARLDWQVLCELATRMGYPMHYESPEAIFAEFASLTTSYAGLDYAKLGSEGKLWPCSDRTQPDGPAVLFGDRFPTKTGRGKFVPAEFSGAKELPDDEYPLVLNTGRLLEHWHTGTMTRRAKALDALAPEATVELHPDDAAELGVAEGEMVEVASRRGQIALKARLSRSVQRGSVFIPFHFREAAANLLTIDALDPYGKIPEFKFCAVRIRRVSE